MVYRGRSHCPKYELFISIHMNYSIHIDRQKMTFVKLDFQI